MKKQKDLTTISQKDLALLAWKKYELGLKTQLIAVNSELSDIDKKMTKVKEDKLAELTTLWNQQIEQVNEKIAFLNFKIIIHRTNYYNASVESRFYKEEFEVVYQILCEVIDIYDENGVLTNTEKESYETYEEYLCELFIDRSIKNFQQEIKISYKNQYKLEYDSFTENSKIKSELEFRLSKESKELFVENFRAALTLNKIQTDSDTSQLFDSIMNNMKLLN
jgi:hypothetical protein